MSEPTVANTGFFTSMREKRYWICALAVLIAIYSTLFINQPLANRLQDPDLQAVFFMLGMLMIAATIVVNGLIARTSWIEWSILIGICAVYLMLIFRLQAPERSHLIEYSVLAVFIYMALKERANQINVTLKPAILSIVISFLIGLLDELLQLFVPNRVFDLQDIFFNGFAILVAIASSSLLMWIKNRFNLPNNDIR